MSNTTRTLAPDAFIPPALLGWWPVVIGLAVLFLPTYYDLANGLWGGRDQAHGPLVLAVSLYLLWQARDAFYPKPDDTPRPLIGWGMLVAGLLLYAGGRAFDILMFEVGAQIPVFLGVLLITVGMRAVRVAWFPLLFLMFTIPLPGFIIDALTNPLKHYISQIAEHVLYAAGYPIARSGVILQVGQYQLLVADACSGLQSMFSLSAMGFLYLYLMKRTSLARNVLLVASILPVAFAANVVRVMVLVLVTYHFGDAAAQGIIHDTTGVMLFVVGLLILFLLDALLGLVLPDRRRPAPVTDR